MSEKIFKFIINEIPEINNEDYQGYISKDKNPIALIGDDYALNIAILNPKATEFNENTAYMYDGFFYLYRGEASKDSVTEPGIYYDMKLQKYFIQFCDDENSIHVDKYKINENHIACLNPSSISETLREKQDDLFISRESSSKLYIPVIDSTDDVLKRLMKEILIKKNIDIDRFKTRFTDKNALFNFKQVLKGDNKLSMLLFQRGCDAFNLKYTITVEEMNENEIIGKPLTEQAIASSEDTYEI